MLGALFVSLAIAAGAQQPAQPAVAVPDTPQGKHVAAYIAAFNSGDIKKYLAFYEEHMPPRFWRSGLWKTGRQCSPRCARRSRSSRHRK